MEELRCQLKKIQSKCVESYYIMSSKGETLSKDFGGTPILSFPEVLNMSQDG